MTYVIGITGGIGSGKTLVSDHFASLNAPIIDTDIIARLIVEPDQPALLELVSAFGSEILLPSGELNRSQLRTLAFADDTSKATLDAITHPAIRQETVKQVQETNYPYCLVVVPLLTADSPFTAFMKRILVVTANRELKIQRVQQRSGLEKSEIERIMKTQLEHLHERYLELAKANINN